MSKSNANSHQRPSERNANIDILRGWLIVFVILGHIVLGSVHDNVIRYSIYAFHMPLFIGLSGYLINPNSLRGSGLVALVSRYWRRVLLPFIIAFLFFTGVLVFHSYDEGRMTTQMLLSFLHTPYYHLWFVPTLIIWVLAYWLALKLKFPLTMILAVCLISSAIWASIPTSEQWFLLAPLLSKKVVYFFLFFIFGAYLRTGVKNKFLSFIADFKVLPVSIIAACACVYILNIGVDKSPLRAFVWLLMNLVLIMVCTQAMNHKGANKKNSLFTVIIEGLGRNSLPVYLWHVVPLFILKGFDVHQNHIWLYYSVSSILIVAICAFILKFENNNAFMNRVLYGNN